jgi:hypothetical protein
MASQLGFESTYLYHAGRVPPRSAPSSASLINNGSTSCSQLSGHAHLVRVPRRPRGSGLLLTSCNHRLQHAAAREQHASVSVSKASRLLARCTLAASARGSPQRADAAEREIPQPRGPHRRARPARLRRLPGARHRRKGCSGSSWSQPNPAADSCLVVGNGRSGSRARESSATRASALARDHAAERRKPLARLGRPAYVAAA